MWFHRNHFCAVWEPCRDARWGWWERTSCFLKWIVPSGVSHTKWSCFLFGQLPPAAIPVWHWTEQQKKTQDHFLPESAKKEMTKSFATTQDKIRFVNRATPFLPPIAQPNGNHFENKFECLWTKLSSTVLKNQVASPNLNLCLFAKLTRKPVSFHESLMTKSWRLKPPFWN